VCYCVAIREVVVINTHMGAQIISLHARFCRRCAARERQGNSEDQLSNLPAAYFALFSPSFLSSKRDSKPISMCKEVSLSRPCDACGHKIGSGYKPCPKCNVYLCFYCRYVLKTFKKSSQRFARCAVEN
jgi:hypothetical protein